MGRGLAWRMERVALWSSVVVGLCGAYAPPLRYFASCARGLESVLASELSSEVIGASRVTRRYTYVVSWCPPSSGNCKRPARCTCDRAGQRDR